MNLGNCETCKWWVTRFGYNECHRHAPAPNYQGAARGDMRSRIYPLVAADDGCGDYEQKADVQLQPFGVWQVTHVQAVYED